MNGYFQNLVQEAAGDVEGILPRPKARFESVNSTDSESDGLEGATYVGPKFETTENLPRTKADSTKERAKQPEALQNYTAQISTLTSQLDSTVATDSKDGIENESSKVESLKSAFANPQVDDVDRVTTFATASNIRKAIRDPGIAAADQDLSEQKSDAEPRTTNSTKLIKILNSQPLASPNVVTTISETSHFGQARKKEVGAQVKEPVEVVEKHVKVHIGRIEIKAEKKPDRPKRRTTSNQASQNSLDEYLRKQNERSRA